jgi:hypothetical protein
LASEILRWLAGHLEAFAVPECCVAGLLEVVGRVVAELDAEGEDDVAPAVDVPVGDGLVVVELLMLDELELSVCACDRGPHPVRARTATPAVTAVATRVFIPLVTRGGAARLVPRDVERGSCWDAAAVALRAGRIASARAA